MTTTDPILQVRNLTARIPTDYGLVRAVEQVSFSLRRGRTLGLVGESGCGKSMLAKAILGLLPKHAQIAPAAEVIYAGQNLIGMSKKGLRRIVGHKIALVFQDPMTSLNPVMTIGRQVAEAVRHHLGASKAAAHRRAVAMLDLVGIPMPDRRAHQYPHQLSGGLRQRVAIAIALACEPQILIADEPTTALDVTIQAEILDLLSRLQQERQMAMILITHDLGVVAGRTHETAVMYAGRIVEQAPTPILFKQMCMPYTRALMDALPRLSNKPHTPLKAIDGRPPDLTEKSPGCPFAPRCWKADDICTHESPALNFLDGGKHRIACWRPLRADEKQQTA